jgi:hypothetical protein
VTVHRIAHAQKLLECAPIASTVCLFGTFDNDQYALPAACNFRALPGGKLCVGPTDQRIGKRIPHFIWTCFGSVDVKERNAVRKWAGQQREIIVSNDVANDCSRKRTLAEARRAYDACVFAPFESIVELAIRRVAA